MTNNQPIEKQDAGDGRTLNVQGVPWLTIQGEGPFSGRRAVFVRLGGCNLNCPHCDADYTSDRRDWTVEELMTTVAQYDTPFVVITGGEPFRQPIQLFVVEMLRKGWRVQIETNGTVYRWLPFEHPRLSIVCSPKSRHVDPKLELYISAWKYVVQHDNVNDKGLPQSTLGRSDPVYTPAETTKPIYVQPLDEYEMGKNSLNMQTAVDAVLKHGYILCLQTHKIAGLP